MYLNYILINIKGFIWVRTHTWLQMSYNPNPVPILATMKWSRIGSARTFSAQRTKTMSVLRRRPSWLRADSSSSSSPTCEALRRHSGSSSNTAWSIPTGRSSSRRRRRWGGRWWMFIIEEFEGIYHWILRLSLGVCLCVGLQLRLQAWCFHGISLGLT